MADSLIPRTDHQCDQLFVVQNRNRGDSQRIRVWNIGPHFPQ
jgi:hypothetical protein